MDDVAGPSDTSWVGESLISMHPEHSATGCPHTGDVNRWLHTRAGALAEKEVAGHGEAQALFALSYRISCTFGMDE